MTYRSWGAAAAVGTLAAGLLAVPMAAQAAPVMALVADGSGRAAGAFADRLGHRRTAGVFFDTTGRLIVGVTDASAADEVRAAGGYAELVKHSTDDLAAISAKFDAVVDFGGASWGVDPSANRVSVEADSSVSAADFAKLTAIAAPYGDAVDVARVGGHDSFAAAPFTSGGQGIRNDKWKCSLGFNAQNSSGQRFFITAGHCTTGGAGPTFYKVSGGTTLGVLHEADLSSSTGNDFAIVTYTNTDVSAFGTVWVNGAEQQISSSGTATDGESVERVGTISSDLNGAVLVPSTTITMDDDGTLYHLSGMIKTSLCAEQGDSGGPLFDGTKALGILSNSSDVSQPCNSSSPNDTRTYFQPVQEVLNHAGLTVY